MIYVMSDIHGHMARFRSVMKKIDLKPEDTLYVLGDVIDRNADGIRILRELMAMPNVKMTLGNHELMMLQALYYAEAEDEFSYIPPLYRWYNNGGLVTHEHLKHLRKTLRAEVFAYLDRLPVNIEISVCGERFVLAHAASVEDYPMFDYRYHNEREFAVWKRYRAGERRAQDYTLIFGHTPTSSYQNTNPLAIWYGTKCIGIDCGCAYPNGRLACLRLDDMCVFYSEDTEENICC